MKKIIFGLFFCLFLLGFDSVYAASSNTLSSFDFNFPNLYGVYCPYGAVKSDGTLVVDNNGQTEVFYHILYFGNGMDTIFEFDFDYNQAIESELGIVIESGNPKKPLSDSTQINWLREKGLISNDGKWSCPDLDDPEDKNGDGYTKYRSFVSTDGTGSICKASDNSCLVTDMPELEKINYTCTYTGQNTGKKLIISVSEGANGKIIKNVTYPDGVVETLTSGIMLDEDCSQDIYYISKNRKIKFSTETNEGISNNTVLWNLCRDYNQNEIEHFCAENCIYEESACSEVDNSISSGSNSNFNKNDGCYGLLPIVKFIRKGVLSIIQIGIPILLIIMGTIDLAKAVMASDDKEIKTATSKFIKRAIAAVAVFFVVTIVSLIMNLISKHTTSENEKVNNNWLNCWDAAND